MDDHSAATAATMTCRSCGAASGGRAKYCSDCGAKLDSVVASAEYKQVTVLFADVVGSMRIASELSAERLREVMAELADRCSAAVHRYGGTVDKFTGDGIMAVFGAPRALEDHAYRACLTALAIQEDVTRFASGIAESDGVDLRMRIGLDSGQVIVGEIGSESLGYTAIGQQVGMAQRMETVAPPGGVMLGRSTAHLVEGVADLGERSLVTIKGAADPVPAYQLFALTDRPSPARVVTSLVGRQWEMPAIGGLLDRAVLGHGAIVGIVGSPGIGKSRLTREIAETARLRGVDVFAAFCDAHSTQVPFRSVGRLLREAMGVTGLSSQAARDHIRNVIPGADPGDVLLLDDLLGIADPDVAPARIDPHARKRRLAALVNAATLARGTPALVIVEDIHWIDDASESMLAAFLTVIPQTRVLVLLTYRPEYRGELARLAGSQSISLAPLSTPETVAVAENLLGSDPSVTGLARMIADRAAGNPFFVEEMVKDLAERGVLHGQQGARRVVTDVAEITVPATLHATIASRIDRLEPAAKRMLCAAAVIGSRFGVDLLNELGIEPAIADLLDAQLIDQVRFTAQPEYAFHHPLIRAVAYESQLKSDRAHMHRRIAASIVRGSSGADDRRAAVIAEHLDAAGDHRAAYEWHMRAGAWSNVRDVRAARASWSRAYSIARAVADGDGRAAMIIGPLTLLCASAYRVHDSVAEPFEELRRLCTETGDKASLAIGMVGSIFEHILRHGRVREASRLASEHMALIESIGDPNLSVGLPFVPISVKMEAGELNQVLRWSQDVIDGAAGDPTRGDFIVGSPLLTAMASRGFARYCLGVTGWRQDFDEAFAAAHRLDSTSQIIIAVYHYVGAIPWGVLLPDDVAMTELHAALRVAELTGDPEGLGLIRLTLGIALVHRSSPDDRKLGLTTLRQVRDLCRREQFHLCELPVIELYIAREEARSGSGDRAVETMRNVLDVLFTRGQMPYCVSATAVLVETLVLRGSAEDLREAAAVIDRLADAEVMPGFAVRDITVVRLRTLLARANGDDRAYRAGAEVYRRLATALEFEGHMEWAAAMT